MVDKVLNALVDNYQKSPNQSTLASLLQHASGGTGIVNQVTMNAAAKNVSPDNVKTIKEIGKHTTSREDHIPVFVATYDFPEKETTKPVARKSSSSSHTTSKHSKPDSSLSTAKNYIASQGNECEGGMKRKVSTSELLQTSAALLKSWDKSGDGFINQKEFIDGYNTLHKATGHKLDHQDAADYQKYGNKKPGVITDKGISVDAQIKAIADDLQKAKDRRLIGRNDDTMRWEVAATALPPPLLRGKNEYVEPCNKR